MGNWYYYKSKLVLLFLIGSSFLSLTKLPWGFFGHKTINRQAVFSLPLDMLSFYKKNIEYITEHAVDPDKRRYIVPREAPCHYIDLDFYENPFENLPKTWTKAVEMYTEDSLLKHGIVPWHIVATKRKLQNAFEEKNVDLILKYSSDIGHYIADAHVPLHTTSNYNGQKTNQNGIHGLWESRLVELFSVDYSFLVGKAHYIANVPEFTWGIIKESHNAVDSVLAIEKYCSETCSFPKYTFEQRGSTTIKTYSREFSDYYHVHLNNMVERKMRSSMLAISSFWYTAWVDAGQPNLRLLMDKNPSNAYQDEIKKLEEEYNSDKIKGRICEH